MTGPSTVDHMTRMREAARGSKRVIPSASKLLRVIRLNCIECCGGERGEVAKCTAPKCRLFPYRLGAHGLRNPDKYDLDGGTGHDLSSGHGEAAR